MVRDTNGVGTLAALYKPATVVCGATLVALPLQESQYECHAHKLAILDLTEVGCTRVAIDIYGYLVYAR